MSLPSSLSSFKEEETESRRGEVHLEDDINPDDIIKIFLATDVHLGYKESDSIIGDDTFRTFEEILQLAKESEADMLMLGGDLFHETRPSQSCFQKCINLLKKYCLGDRPIYIEFFTDLKGNLSNDPLNTLVNYEDPNLNISLPVLSIHGNHDDPTGSNQISALDIISATGFVNYFGRWDSHSEVHVKPLLLRKGQTKMAIYGLSHIKDERLGRLYLAKKVHFEETPDDWFKFLVWHQNRVARASKSYIQDDSLPSFLDLVLWGHEHDCRITPERMPNGVYITQPGSPVATSLSIGESITKKVGILKVHKTTFELEPITLKTVRPFIYDELILDEPSKSSEDVSVEVKREVTAKVFEMIETAKEQSSDLLPLIRLQVRYTNEKQVLNTIRFGHEFDGKVANTSDMMKFSMINKRPVKGNDRLSDTMDVVVTEDTLRLEDLVLEHFEKNPTLQVISAKGMTEAVSAFVNANNNDAIKNYIEQLNNELINKLVEQQTPIEEIDDVICHTKIKHEMNQRRKASVPDADVMETIEIMGSDEEETGMANTSVNTSTRGRRGRGRSTSGTRRGRARGKAN